MANPTGINQYTKGGGKSQTGITQPKHARLQKARKVIARRLLAAHYGEGGKKYKF